jgi:predicted Fe-Mo cluster-binding NifX family protein
VAVASETGENIDACFGRTGCFRIYALADDGGTPAYVPLETRPGPRPCRDREHDLGALSACADLLSDCGMVLAGKIGPAALQILASRGILGLSVRLPLDEALRRLAAR